MQGRRLRARVSSLSSNRINHFAHLSYDGGWESASLRMLLNQRIVVGKVDAERFVASDIGVFPLDILLFCFHVRQHAIRFLRSVTQRFAVSGADVGNIPLNHVSRNDVPSFLIETKCYSNLDVVECVALIIRSGGRGSGPGWLRSLPMGRWA